MKGGKDKKNYKRRGVLINKTNPAAAGTKKKRKGRFKKSKGGHQQTFYWES
jgi:hypothetical protein